MGRPLRPPDRHDPQRPRHRGPPHRQPRGDHRRPEQHLPVGESAAGPINNGSPHTKVSEIYSASLVTTVTDATLAKVCRTIDTGDARLIANNAGHEWRYKGYSYMDGTMGRSWF